MHRLHAPPLRDEASGQPVKQLGMAGAFSAQAEIARRLHQAGAEVMLPDAIHHHACGERVVRTGDGAGEFEPSAAALKRRALRAGDDFEKLPRHLLSETRRAATIEDARVGLRLAVGQHECRGSAKLDEPAVHLSLQLPQFLRGRSRKEHIIIHDVGVGYDRGRIGVAQERAKRRSVGRIGLLFGIGEDFPVTPGDLGHGCRRRVEGCCDHRVQLRIVQH